MSGERKAGWIAEAWSGAPSPEVRLLLNLSLRPADPAEEDALAAVGAKHVDWERFARLGENHRVTPLLVSRSDGLRRVGCPEGVIDELRDSAGRLQHMNLALTALALDVMVRLEGEGIHPLLLKGPVTAMDLYGSLSGRPFHDLDILVPPQSLEHVGRLLVNEGFVRSPLEDPRLDHRPETGSLGFFKGNLLVEVHRFLKLSPGQRGRLEHADALRRHRRIQLAASRVATLGAEDTVLYLLVHGSSHRWARIRWLADVVRLPEAGLQFDWSGLLQEATRRKCRRAFLLGLKLASHYGGMAMPAELEGPAELQGPAAVDPAIEGLLSACAPLWEVYDAEQSDLDSLPFRVRLADDWLRRAGAIREAALQPHGRDLDVLPFLPPTTPVVFSALRPFRLGVRYLQERLGR